MIKKIELVNFKAYENLIIDVGNKNFLLYGDNGSGKSSIYEALKVFFFKDKLINSLGSAATQEEQQQVENDFFSKYINVKANGDSKSYTVKINDDENMDISQYQVFMLNLESCLIKDYLNLKELLEQAYFNIPDNFYEKKAEIQSKTNQLLIEFLENITVTIDDDFHVKISDSDKSITEEKRVKEFFNEARLNLVVLSLLLSCIEISKVPTKNKILIVDDFITSLDMSNRTFLMRYILINFHDFQILQFTHNIHFYNLIMYLDQEIVGKKNWEYANLYVNKLSHDIYMNRKRTSADDLQKELDKAMPDYPSIGNKIRKKFERILYEFSKVFMIGAVEESDRILTILDKKNVVYLKESKDVYDLIDEVASLAFMNQQHDIIDVINSYQLNNLNIIKSTLKNLKLYRKVAMHPLSHGSIGNSSYSKKELEQSLILIRKLEINIKDLQNKRVEGL